MQPAPTKELPAERAAAERWVALDRIKSQESRPFLGWMGRSGLALASKLSYQSLWRLGGSIGGLAARFPTRERMVTRVNLRLCWPELSDAQRSELERTSLAETGRSIAELAALWRWERERVLDLVPETSGEEHLTEALDHRRGVILIVPHLGSWEMVGLFVSARHSLNAMYGPPRALEMEPIYRNARERFGAKLVKADASGVRALCHALSRGEICAILPDQAPVRGSGLFVPFFGVAASTSVIIPRLLARSGARAVFAWAERLADGAGFRLHFTPASEALYSRDVESAARALNLDVEQRVRASPTQYLWSYKRFRFQPKGFADPYKTATAAG